MENSEKNRDLEIIKEPEKISYVIHKHLGGQRFRVSGTQPPQEVDIVSVRGLNHLVLNFREMEPNLQSDYTLYSIVNRYLHINGRIVQNKVDGGRYDLMLIKHLAIAKKKRASVRISIKHEKVFVSNIRMSGNDISKSMTRIPIYLKLGLDELKKQLQNKAEHVDVQVRNMDLKVIKGFLQQLNQQGKPLLLSNTMETSSYTPFNASYFNYAAYLGKEMNARMVQYKKMGIVSEIYIPIIYLSNDKTQVPIGHIHMQNKSKYLSPTDVKEAWEMTKATIRRIRMANTKIINERQHILDISRGGMMILIKNEQLMTHLQQQKTIIFDLFFAMQAPITLYTAIRTIIPVPEGIRLGVQISGSSMNTNEMKRFNDNMDELESSGKVSEA